MLWKYCIAFFPRKKRLNKHTKYFTRRRLLIIRTHVQFTEKARVRETKRQVVKVGVFIMYVRDVTCSLGAFTLGTRFYRSILDNVVANFQNNKIKTLLLGMLLRSSKIKTNQVTSNLFFGQVLMTCMRHLKIDHAWFTDL